ncbi:unnamed protein product, partial [Closterium sp. NIES-53]
MTRANVRRQRFSHGSELSESPPARWDGGQQCVLHEGTRFHTLAAIAIRCGAQLHLASLSSCPTQIFS